MKQVDTHAHVFRADSPLAPGARYRPAADATPQAYLAHLDQHGFEYGVLIQPSFLACDNTQMLAAIAANPQRLKGVAVVAADSDPAALKALNQQGIVGLRLNLFGQPAPDLSGPAWRRLLAQAEALGWQIELHCPPQLAHGLMAQLRDYQAPVVLDHFGRIDPGKGVQDPDYQRVLALLDPGRHWVKVSGFYRLGQGHRGESLAQEALALLLDLGMRDHLVWGSDWPHTQFHQSMTYEAAVAFMAHLLPDAALRSQILADNACRLFGFPA